MFVLTGQCADVSHKSDIRFASASIEQATRVPAVPEKIESGRVYGSLRVEVLGTILKS